MIGAETYALPATKTYSGRLLTFLLVDLQLFLFIFPFSSFFVSMPEWLPLEKPANILSTMLIGLSLFYLSFMRKPDIPWQRATVLFLFVVYIGLSVFWTDTEVRQNGISFTIRTLLTIAQSFVIVAISLEKGSYLFDTLKRLAILISVASFLFLVLFPERAAWTIEATPRVQSFFSSPNNMGQFLSFAFLVINFHKTRSLPVLALIAIDALLIYQLIQCDSMTSFLGMAIISTSFFFRFTRKLLFVFIVLAGLAVPHVKSIMDRSASLDFIHRDLSFTGRTDIWDIMLQDIDTRDRWAFGYGFGSYWPLEAEGANPVTSVSQLDWDPGQGHNGYIDILATCGVVGLIIFLVFLFQLGNQLFRQKDFDRIVYFLVMIVLFNNITESSFFRMKHFYFVLLMLMFWYIFFQYRNSVSEKRALEESDPILMN